MQNQLSVTLYEIVELFTAATIIITAAGKMAAALRTTFNELCRLKEVAV